MPQLRQVVGDQVLWLFNEVHELTDAAIAAGELADQLPSEWVAQQSQDLGRLLRRHQATISNQIDGMQEMRYREVLP